MATKKTTKPADEIISEQNDTPTEHADKPSTKKEHARIDDGALIRVKSNTFGQLVYINKRTGDKTEWSHFGDEQSITMADLRAMKGTQNGFFSDNMIIVTGIEDDRYDGLEPADIYDALLVSKYYKNLISPDNFGTLFKMSDKEIRERVKQMSSNARLNLVVALNNAIGTGVLDSLKKIRLFEEVLGCELADPK